MKSRKTTKIEIYEEDLPILAAFMEHSSTKTNPEAFRYGMKLFSVVADDNKKLRAAAKKQQVATAAKEDDRGYRLGYIQ